MTCQDGVKYWHGKTQQLAGRSGWDDSSVYLNVVGTNRI